MTDRMFAVLNCCLVGKIHLHTGSEVVNSQVHLISCNPLLDGSNLSQVQDVFLCENVTAMSTVSIKSMNSLYKDAGIDVSSAHIKPNVCTHTLKYCNNTYIHCNYIYIVYKDCTSETLFVQYCQSRQLATM